MTTGQHIAAAIAFVPAAIVGALMVGSGVFVLGASIAARLRINLSDEPRVHCRAPSHQSV